MYFKKVAFICQCKGLILLAINFPNNSYQVALIKMFTNLLEMQFLL